MGDRGNIRIRQPYAESEGPQYIYLYSHWSGYLLWDILKTALLRRQRWTDPAYLARIIFDVMTQDASSPETGYGIATDPPDNSYPFLTVDTVAQTVGIGDGSPIPFEEYLKLTTDPRT